jgi:hypothetical protein
MTETSLVFPEVSIGFCSFDLQETNATSTINKKRALFMI